MEGECFFFLGCGEVGGGLFGGGVSFSFLGCFRF